MRRAQWHRLAAPSCGHDQFRGTCPSCQRAKLQRVADMVAECSRIAKDSRDSQAGERTM
jgi:hypothetical protein